MPGFNGMEISIFIMTIGSLIFFLIKSELEYRATIKIVNKPFDECCDECKEYQKLGIEVCPICCPKKVVVR